MAASSLKRHRYNYRGNKNSEDDDKDFFASHPDDNGDEDLSDVEVVENPSQKSRE